MPSTSAKQAKFMRAVAHSPSFAKKVGVPQSVGKDYAMADKKMKKFGDGGAAKKMPKEPVTGGPNTVPLTPERKEFLKELERRNKEQRDESAKLAKKATPYAKGGKVGESKKAMELRHARTLTKLAGEERKEAAGYKKGGKMADKAGRAMKKKSADTMGRAMAKYAKGGSVSARADGIAKKGKTKTKHVAMARGGKCM